MAEKARVVVSSGKRKTAVARAVVRPGKGRIWINNAPVEIHQPFLARDKILEPVIIAREAADRVDIRVEVAGGGVMGQASAARTAIARGLSIFHNSPDLTKRFRQYDRMLLVNDDRRKLPKMQLGRGARKRRQKSYR
jgi:small subunit ribosomal protein S9